MTDLVAPPDTQTTIPLRRAALCLDCEAVFLVQEVCPACASASWMPMAICTKTILEKKT